MVLSESLDFLAAQAAGERMENEIPVVVFNPSPWQRNGRVSVEVVPHPNPRLGERLYGWSGETKELQLENYALIDAEGGSVPFTITGERYAVEDSLYRRKMLTRVRLDFDAYNVPAHGCQLYRLVPSDTVRPQMAPQAASDDQAPALENEFLRVTAESDGTLTVQDKRSGRVFKGMNQFIDEADAGDEYTFSPPVEQKVYLSTQISWQSGYGYCDDPRTIVLKGLRTSRVFN